MRTVTLAVAAVAAVSLVVAGVLVMNVMLVAIAQRRAEIGLMKALGAENRDIRLLFLLEAVLLTLVGALAGAAVGNGAAVLVRTLYPTFPAAVPWWGMSGALVVSLVCGIAFGVGPARRASMLDPVQALFKR